MYLSKVYTIKYEFIGRNNKTHQLISENSVQQDNNAKSCSCHCFTVMWN